MKFKKIFIGILLLFQGVIAQENFKGNIVGTVRDRLTKQPLPNANIVIRNSKFGSASDEKGKFLINSVPIGNHTVSITIIGYKSIVKTDIIVSTGANTILNIEMDEEILKESEVVVTESFFEKRTEEVSSIHVFAPEEIRRAPGAMEDVSRVVQMLPGVTTSVDMRNDIIVRGGNPIENLTVIDNFEIPNINHFGTFGSTGGAIGMVDVKFIDNLRMNTGGFSVKYGDKLSSVMDISLRAGDENEFHGQGTISNAGAGISFEGPGFLEKDSWIFSYRKSFLNLIYKAVHLTSIPVYSDLFFKYDFPLSEKNKISLLGFGGHDTVYFSDPEDHQGWSGIWVDTKQYLLGASLTTLIGTDGYNILSFSKNNINYADGKRLDSVRAYDFQFGDKADEIEFTLKNDFVYKISSSQNLMAGISFKSNSYDFWGFSIVPSPLWLYQTFDTTSRKITSKKAAAYLQFSEQFLNNYSATLGVRSDYFSLQDKNYTISPRLSLSYKMDEISTITFSIGKFYQWLPLNWLTIDQKNSQISPLEANHYILGFEKLFTEDTRLMLEIFIKNYINYSVSESLKSFIMVDAGAGYDVNTANSLLDGGRGLSYGFDFLLQKKYADGLYGVISYTFNVTSFKALIGASRPGAWDSKHNLTISGGYTIDRETEISLKYRFISGRPYTPFDSEKSSAAHFGIQYDDKMNSIRYPNYHRVDIRFDKKYYFENWIITTFLEIENLFNTKNIFGYRWDENKNKQETIYQIAIVPAGGIRIEF